MVHIITATGSNGTYWEQNPWNNTRIYFDSFGQLHVYFAHLAESVKVSITARTTSHTVTVRNDAGIRVDNTAYTVARWQCLHHEVLSHRRQH